MTDQSRTDLVERLMERISELKTEVEMLVYERDNAESLIAQIIEHVKFDHRNTHGRWAYFEFGNTKHILLIDSENESFAGALGKAYRFIHDFNKMEIPE